MRRALRRQVLGQCLPLATRREHVEDCVENLANIHLAPTAAALGWRDHRLNQRPFGIRQVTRISQTTPLSSAAMFRFPHLGTPQSTIRVPHNESQMIHPTQQLSGSALSRSAIDLQSVLDALVRSATRLTQAEMGSLVQPEGSVFRQLASCGYPQELDEFMQTHPVHLGRGTITGRTLVEGKPVQVADVLVDPEFTFVESVKIGGMRTMLGVPLLRDGVPIGVIVLSRRMVRPFSDAQIEVVQNFAAQAVI